MKGPTNSAINELIDTGKDRGYVTYDELVARLPDEYVDPHRMDELLARFEQTGVKLLDRGGEEPRQIQFAEDQSRAALASDAALRRTAATTWITPSALTGPPTRSQPRGGADTVASCLSGVGTP